MVSERKTSTKSRKRSKSREPKAKVKASPTKMNDMDILTGDHGIEKKEELQDFLWSMTDEPHASRRKAMIKEMPDLKHLMGHEPLTKYICIALMAVQFSLAYYFRNDNSSVKFWVVAYVVGATISHALFLANHEISHNLAFRKFSHNKLFGIFVNLPLTLPYFIFFKTYHNLHHKEQGHPILDTDLPTEFEAKYFSSTLGKLFYMFNQTWFYAFRPMFVHDQKLTKWHLLNMACQFSFNGLCVYFFGWGPLIYFFVCAHFAGSLHPLASHFIAEHLTFVDGAETCSYYGILNWLTFNVGYHQEHHDFPTVAWSNLPKLKKKGEKYYEIIPYHKSWVMVLWTFLSDTKITMYNRVKREKQKNKTLDKKHDNNDADYTGAWLNGVGMETVKERKKAA